MWRRGSSRFSCLYFVHDFCRLQAIVFAGLKVHVKMLNFWYRRQRAMALLAGGVCAVSIVEKESSAALALRPQQGQGVREAGALRKERPQGVCSRDV